MSMAALSIEARLRAPKPREPSGLSGKRRTFLCMRTVSGCAEILDWKWSGERRRGGDELEQSLPSEADRELEICSTSGRTRLRRRRGTSSCSFAPSVLSADTLSTRMSATLSDSDSRVGAESAGAFSLSVLALIAATFSAREGRLCRSLPFSAAEMPLTTSVLRRGIDATSSAALPASDPRRDPPDRWSVGTLRLFADRLSFRAVIIVDANADEPSVGFFPKVDHGDDLITAGADARFDWGRRSDCDRLRGAAARPKVDQSARESGGL
mmetsp:Transcript_7020/g.17992  ORF Transcript_7020/g.17992 Transcript_7020/m.17992 type:complete len:268 (+) Transcript_7020:87-890(+)